MAKEKILVVEDEEAIQELIRYNLNKEGFDRVRLCDSGEARWLRRPNSSRI